MVRADRFQPLRHRRFYRAKAGITAAGPRRGQPEVECDRGALVTARAALLKRDQPLFDERAQMASILMRLAGNPEGGCVDDQLSELVIG